MKILFVTDLYPIGNEKIAKALFYFVMEWKKQGHNIEVIRPNFVLNTIIRGRKIIQEKVYYENDIKIYNLNFYTPFLFNIYKKLPMDFSIKNYDVIISHMPSGALFSNRLLEKDKIKYICSVHSSDITVLTDCKYSIYFKNQLKKAYLNADKISARSPILKNKIENIIPQIKNKTFTAYSGIDENLINNCEKVSLKNKNTINITTVSSLIKRKNIDIIIKALSQIKEKNFIFKIIGDGPERKKLEKLSKNLSNKIIFTGNINRNEVIEELKKSDIFILISNNETFGLSYLEALATNNIIIAKKNDGIDGILKNKINAFLINPNEQELINCFNNILSLNNEEINELKANIENTIKKYTLNEAGQNYLKNI